MDEYTFPTSLCDYIFCFSYDGILYRQVFGFKVQFRRLDEKDLVNNKEEGNMVIVIVVIMFMLAAGIVFALVFGGKIEKYNDSGIGLLLFFVSAVFVALGAFMAHENGTGELCIYSLKSNAIYETQSSVPDGAGKYAVILKERDGSLSAYILKQDPPKMFKVKDTPGGQIFEQFPQTPPASSVLSKK